MKKITVLIACIFVFQSGNAQLNSVAAIINKIDIREDTIKSVFNWVAYNIKYDISKLNDLKSGKTPASSKSISTQQEFRESQLEKVISARKGVCEDYSVLFDAIMKELGYKSEIIEGYTKNEKGKVQKSIGHTWNAVKVNGIWKLYDPTWGAGYIVDNRKYIKHYNAKWFDVRSEDMLKTHMPFDPMWQLSENPISYSDFENNTNTSVDHDKYKYEELINAHYSKDQKERLKDQIQRSQNIGDGVKLISNWRDNLLSQIDDYEISIQPISIEEVNRILEESYKKFNNYIKAKNKQFKSKKWTREYSKQNLLQIKEDITSIITTYKTLEINDSHNQKTLNRNILQTEKFLARVESELRYLNK